MNRIAYPRNKTIPYVIVAIEYTLYITLFMLSFDRVRWGIAPLAMVPVGSASWYFGIRGGIPTAILSILANIILPVIFGRTPGEFFSSSGNVVGSLALLLLAVIIGRLSTVTHERGEALRKLETYENERREHIQFLESLNEITGMALEAGNLQASLKVLVERIARLFKAEDVFLAYWDEDNKITTPVIAYGPMSQYYPKLNFEAGERTPTAMVMEVERPLAIQDLKSSSISPRIASMFPSNSMLGIPLIAQGKKIAAFYLGYRENREFDQNEIARAEIAAQQIALVLTKIQTLEETQRQLKQLRVLHEVALIATQVESIDRLIECTTEIIGKNLFPDNFGILLMNEEKGVLQPHPSYRFVAAKKLIPTDVPLGKGVTGQVAVTGQPIRIGNVVGFENYLDVDQSTSSELCVPIKLKDRVLGIINAESTRTDAFSMDDEFLLGTLAGQLATAIEQLRVAAAERQWLDQLAHSNDLIYALAHITTHIEKALSPDEIIQVLGRELRQLKLTCATALYHENQRAFIFNYTSMESELLEQLETGIGFPLPGFRVSLSKLKSVTGIEGISQPMVVSNPEEEIQILFPHRREDGIANILEGIGIVNGELLLRLPLTFEKNLLGILWVWGKGITGGDLPVMSIFAKQIGISLERARLFQEVQGLALTDSLTGLHNRRGLFELGRMEFSRAHRTKRPFCCMMLDLDHFKQINDDYGHAAGDQILQEFAQRCKDSVREVDLIGRYGGEELIILLPETERIRAVRVAERLRASVAQKPVNVAHQEISITVSIGVAAKDENTHNLETLIARADQAMYIAKHKGRNRVSVGK